MSALGPVVQSWSARKHQISKYPKNQIRDEKTGVGEQRIWEPKEREQGIKSKTTANIGNITKMKPGLTWLIARGSAGVPGETSWYCCGLDVGTEVGPDEACRDMVESAGEADIGYDVPWTRDVDCSPVWKGVEVLYAEV
jgi:hypothetical protein